MDITSSGRCSPSASDPIIRAHAHLLEIRQGFLAAFAVCRAFPACSLLFVALMVAAVWESPVLAADAPHSSVIQLSGTDESLDPDLVLSCPQGNAAEPRLKNQKTGKTFPIADARLRAVATKACSVAAPSPAEQGTVHIVNTRGAAIWVSFSGSSINWKEGCAASGYPGTVKILPSGTCEATVPSTNTASRFCASPIAGSLDCSNAQQNHQTLTEANFQPNCFSTQSSCIWYDICVIPLNGAPYLYCTDCAWKGNACLSPPPTNAKTYCANTGDVAFNLPVELSCSQEPTYTCRGPQQWIHAMR
jgi:hypothetical protein